MRNLQVIKYKLIMNRNCLSVEADLFIDDKFVKTIECHSFVDGFLRRLYTQVGGDLPNQATPAATGSNSELMGTVVNAWGSTPIIVQLHAFAADKAVQGDRIIITGAGTTVLINNTEANPYWIVNPVAYSETHYRLLNSTGPGALIEQAGGSYVWHCRKLAGKGRDTLAFRVNAPVNNDVYGMLIGTGSTAVRMWDKNLVTKVTNGTGSGQLLYSGVTFGTPTIYGSDAYFTVTRSFTNNSGASITVRELSLVSFFNTNIHPSNSNVFYHILSRDVTGDVVIPINKTLIVNYRVKVTLGSEGGFLRQMIELLYRQFAQAAINAQTVWNTSNSVGASIDQLNMNELHYGVPPNGDLTLDRGIVVGTDNTAVSLSDYAMLGRIYHGNELGQLFHYGTVVGSYVENVVSGYCQLDVFRIFENKSGSSIIVRENGIYAFSSETALHCVARHRLPTSITVVANGLLKVIYTLKIIG